MSQGKQVDYAKALVEIENAEVNLRRVLADSPVVVSVCTKSALKDLDTLKNSIYEELGVNIKDSSILDKPIGILDFPYLDCLREIGCKTIRDLVELPENRLMLRLGPITFETLRGECLLKGVSLLKSDMITLDELRLMPNVNISVRVYSCLKRAGYTRLCEIAKLSRTELLGIKNLGEKAVNDIVSIMESFGYEIRRD